MYVLPVVTSMDVAMESMEALHQNLSWLVVLFAMIAISTGFIELRRAQIELAEKSDLLADPVVQIGQIPPRPIVQFDLHRRTKRQSRASAHETSRKGLLATTWGWAGLRS